MHVDLASWLMFFFFQCYRPHRDLHSFPTRRSSDLKPWPATANPVAVGGCACTTAPTSGRRRRIRKCKSNSLVGLQDRKSTRLNSSHGYISYAVFCLKKKKKELHFK